MGNGKIVGYSVNTTEMASSSTAQSRTPQPHIDHSRDGRELSNEMVRLLSDNFWGRYSEKSSSGSADIGQLIGRAAVVLAETEPQSKVSSFRTGGGFGFKKPKLQFDGPQFDQVRKLAGVARSAVASLASRVTKALAAAKAPPSPLSQPQGPAPEKFTRQVYTVPYQNGSQSEFGYYQAETDGAPTHSRQVARMLASPHQRKASWELESSNSDLGGSDDLAQMQGEASFIQELPIPPSVDWQLSEESRMWRWKGLPEQTLQKNDYSLDRALATYLGQEELHYVSLKTNLPAGRKWVADDVIEDGLRAILDLEQSSPDRSAALGEQYFDTKRLLFPPELFFHTLPNKLLEPQLDRLILHVCPSPSAPEDTKHLALVRKSGQWHRGDNGASIGNTVEDVKNFLNGINQDKRTIELYVPVSHAPKRRFSL